MGGGGKKYLTPETLMRYFNDYHAQAKKLPIKVKDWVGGAGRQVMREKEKPLTIEGFENYCAAKGIIQDLGEYFSNNEGRYADFIQVCKLIKRIIRQDQIEGGMAGIYNPNITQRLNGLVEKTENKHEVNEIIIKRKS